MRNRFANVAFRTRIVCVSNEERTMTLGSKAGFWCYLSIALTAVFLAGCTDKWDSAGHPNVQGTNAMSGVSNFIAANGWNMCTNSDYLANWDNLSPRQIAGLPWTKYKNKQFWAVTCDGILYVLSAPGWHGDYGGVAYNPTTNHFPVSIEGFKSVGDHWYVWCSFEFAPSGLPKEYE